MLCMGVVVQCAAAIAACILSSSSAMWLLRPNMSITRAITNKWFSNPFTLPPARPRALLCRQTRGALLIAKTYCNYKQNTKETKHKRDKIQNINCCLPDPTLPPVVCRKTKSACIHRRIANNSAKQNTIYTAARSARRSLDYNAPLWIQQAIAFFFFIQPSAPD